MVIGVCTLFEGDYALGAAALVNSLARKGFRGAVFAGHRGPPPPWDVSALAKCGIQLQFNQITTTSHLANYKPDFMLDVLVQNVELTHLCYFDPDIVLSAEWKFFEEWLTCGIALCEDVNSPLSANHPRRVGWQRHLASDTRKFEHRTDVYVNAGFVGICREDMHFLSLWQVLTSEMAKVIGGSDVTKVVGGKDFGDQGFANCFDCPDQDTLNAAVAVSENPISVIGKTGMAFEYGDILMFHAVGRHKPWERNFMAFALAGVPPRACDKAFFRFLDGPVSVPIRRKLLRRLSLLASTAIGRIWRRSS